MATIFYGIAGEGRGHATRAMAILEELIVENRVVVYTSGQALGMLRPWCFKNGVEVRELPEVRFAYDHRNRLNYASTFLQNLHHLAGFERLLNRIEGAMQIEAPALVITDFDPLLPRAARRLGIPVVSVDHQHFLTIADPTQFPMHLRNYVRAMGTFVRVFGGLLQEETVVSSFFQCKTRRSFEHAHQVGVMLRKSVRDMKPTVSDHWLVYARRGISRRVLDSVEQFGVPTKVYGLGYQPARGNIEFCKVDADAFINDLASCRALISTAGNQLIGEAGYFGKPVFAMPEQGNREQEVNAHFVRIMGIGETCPVDAISANKLRQFEARMDSLPTALPYARACGNQATLGVLRKWLPAAVPAAVPVVAAKWDESFIAPLPQTREAREIGAHRAAG